MRTQRVRTRKRMTVGKMYPLYIRQISFKEIYVKLTCLCQIIRFLCSMQDPQYDCQEYE